jgi:hypothetical protein
MKNDRYCKIGIFVKNWCFLLKISYSLLSAKDVPLESTYRKTSNRMTPLVE